MRPLDRLAASLILAVLTAIPASAVTMDWTPIGNPGNACDPQTSGECFGAVGYAYSIGTYEVTNAQYVEFLNAKAASDPYQLYNPAMGPDPTGTGYPYGYGGITRSGSSGSYTYSAILGRENMPVNWVSYYDALRFANWMNNGQGNGDTETGSYTLLGGTAIPTNSATVARNAGATIVLTGNDEWYKAAYFSALSTSYFDYPAGSNTQTVCAPPTASPNSANCGGWVINVTNVGSYIGSASPYGTYDQGGNVWERMETRYFGNYQVRGGSFGTQAILLNAASSAAGATPGEGEDAGFRLAMIPEPSTGLLVIAGLIGLGIRRGNTA